MLRCVLAFVLLVSLVVSRPVAADDGIHRTTPRASLESAGATLVIGVPGGRAWGVESELRPLPPRDTALFVRLSVTDAGVRETFVRIAYYASATGRTRQLATSDSPPVTLGRPVLVGVALDPPPGAVAYRVRVLVRLIDPSGRSANDAVTARLRGLASRPAGSLFSRLLP